MDQEMVSLVAVVMVIIAYMQMYYIKEAEHGSLLQGKAYYDEIMRTRSS